MPENRQNGILKLQLELELSLKMRQRQGGYAGTLSNMESFYGKLSLEEQEKTIKARAEVDLKKSDVELVDIFFDRSEEIQKEILNQMKTERKPEFVNKLHSRRGATLTNVARTPLAEPEGLVNLLLNILRQVAPLGNSDQTFFLPQI